MVTKTEIGGKDYCEDSSIVALSQNLPDEIKFTLDPASCEIKGFEYKSNQLIEVPAGFSQGGAELLVATSADKNLVEFYPETSLSNDYKHISVSDFKNMTFSKTLKALEHIWGDANSASIEPNENWTGDRVKLQMGKQARRQWKSTEFRESSTM